MIAAPYRKAAAWLATMPGSPGSTMNGSEPAYCWKTSGSALTKVAPRMEPHTEPRPPSTIIARNCTESASPNESGATEPIDSA